MGNGGVFHCCSYQYPYVLDWRPKIETSISHHLWPEESGKKRDGVKASDSQSWTEKTERLERECVRGLSVSIPAKDS